MFCPEIRPQGFGSSRGPGTVPSFTVVRTETLHSTTTEQCDHFKAIQANGREQKDHF